MKNLIIGIFIGLVLSALIASTKPAHEYSVNLELYGYDVFDQNGNYIGSANTGNCDLDNVFITDNE